MMASSPWPTPLEEWQFLLARELAGIFDAEAWEARDGAVRFRGRLLLEPDRAFAILSDRLRPLGYVPQLLRPDEIALLRLPPARLPSGARRPWLPAVLFLATVLTTFWAGATDFDSVQGLWDFAHALLATILGGGPSLKPPRILLDFRGGLVFSASIMTILGVHELGHYVTARLYGMRVSLPYFIPMPISLMGTMGAVIRMRSPVPHRRALFDVGIAGPLAGLAVAIPVAVVGLYLSTPVPAPGPAERGMGLVPSLLFSMIMRLLLQLPPQGWTVSLHPMAVAGWLGFFVTALNLIPAGQLDGGHVSYAVLGRWHDKLALFAVLALFTMAALLIQPLWALWGGLLLILGYRHPPPLNDLTPLTPVRRILGVLCWGLLVLLFTPIPFVIR
jgi:Zn-dependent protease